MTRVEPTLPPNPRRSADVLLGLLALRGHTITPELRSDLEWLMSCIPERVFFPNEIEDYLREHETIVGPNTMIADLQKRQPYVVVISDIEASKELWTPVRGGGICCVTLVTENYRKFGQAQQTQESLGKWLTRNLQSLQISK